MKLKKIIGLTLAILLLVTGCGEKSGEDVVKSVSDKVSEASSYNLKATWKYMLMKKHLLTV